MADDMNGGINIERLVRGTPLEFKVCQKCPGFKRNGYPIPKEDRGWLKES